MPPSPVMILTHSSRQGGREAALANRKPCSGGMVWKILVWMLIALPGQLAWSNHLNHPVELNDQDKINLKGHLAVHRNQGQCTGVESVAPPSEDQFQNIAGSISEGFTDDAVWISFTLAKPARETHSIWWLEIGQPLLFNAVLYQKSKEGDFHRLSGLLNRKIFSQPQEYKKSIFEIDLDKAEDNTYYLCIKSSAAISSELLLWEPGEFVAHATAKRFAWGLIYGAYLFSIIFFSMVAMSTRNRVYWIYTLYIINIFLISFFSGAWPLQFLPDLSLDTFFKGLGLCICLAPSLSILFTFAYIELPTRWIPVFQCVKGLVIMVSLAGVYLVMTNRFNVAIPWVQACSMVVMLLGFVFGMIQSVLGNPNARYFLMAFSVFYLGAVVRWLKNIGYLDSNVYTENGYHIGAFVHMLIMSGSILLYYRKMNEENKHAQYQLKAQQELQKDQMDFISMVSHELKTPLSIISASCDNTLADPHLGEDSRSRVEKIVRANDRMGSLLKDFLIRERLLSESSDMVAEDFNLNEMLHSTASEFAVMSGQPAVETPLTPVWIHANEQLMKLVLFNLLNNAMRYAPGCEPIMRCRAYGEWAEFSVFNEGEGIPDQELPLIFKKYYRGSNSAGTAGSGLGLYLVKIIVEKYQGYIQASNLEGRGCEFVIRMPRVRTDAGHLP